ncbi:beta-galactosidase [Pedobacter nyackensis]|uniref:beta-galactosidase n=1 Tax=Pedobacter nyackensis TaxID=475255 RepID=UPI00292DBB2C|nr:beta-galactosidase [Pedobacter nyackensis]
MRSRFLLALFLLFSTSCLYCKKKESLPTILQEENNGNPDQTPDDSLNTPNGTLFKDMIGVNGFDWEYTQNNSTELDNNKIELIKTFSSFRQYLDWEKIEPEEGSFNLGHYDKIYNKNFELKITTLLCLQIIPSWMRRSYPEYNESDPFSSLRDYTPVRYGADKSSPASYIQMAKVAFQFAARYGSNTNIDKSLIKAPSYEQGSYKIGLNTLKYLECSNEPDKNWRGPNAQQTPEQYAAQLSAFYDGHMGTLGANVGAKTADPNIKVVMAGLADPDPEFVRKMINWCKINRVKNGKYTLCFDVINYHQYSNENMKKGKAPELTNVGSVAADFVKMSKEDANGAEVWVTECGFDVNPSSPQRAIAIGNKSTRDTQADWSLRTSLLYARKGIKRTFFFMLNDVNINDATQYSSSGLVESGKRRPAADFLLQAKNLMGEYTYQKTISTDPIVDLYTSGNSKIYVLTIPDQKDRKANYTIILDIGIQEVTIYNPLAGAESMISKKVAVNDKLVINVTETPTFVKVN